MTRRTRGCAIGLLLSGLVCSGRAQTPAQQPIFRANTDVVTVDVSVRAGSALVPGLTAADFVLLDNGVPQHIDRVLSQAVPIDVSLVLDTSRYVQGIASQMQSEVRQIAAMLRPDDRLRLLTIDTYASQVFAMQPASARPPVATVVTDGLASVFDALAAAMIRPVEPNRRHLVVAVTDGWDTISTLDAKSVSAIAKQSDAVLHIVQVPVSVVRCAVAIDCTPAPRFRPRRELELETLAEAAQLTGGQLHDPNVFGTNDEVNVFKKVFDDFRSGYVLSYTPKGVARGGWHALTVTVPKSTSYKIEARKGYAVEVAPADNGKGAGTIAPAAGRATRSGTPAPMGLPDVIDAYGRDDYASVENALAQVHDFTKFIRDFKTGGNPWPASPRREAVFVLELARSALYQHDDGARAEARQLLLDYNPLVRNPLGGDDFERLWYWAELAELEGVIRPDLSKTLVGSALERFPDEPRFVLARAFFVDQGSPFDRQAATAPAADAVVQPNEAAAKRGDELLSLYQDAMKFPSTALEAHVRAAYLLHRLGRNDDALALLDKPDDDGTDAGFLYVRQLVRGHVLDALGRTDLAIEAYKHALERWPSSQTARAGLMTLLLRRGDREGAQALAEAIQTAPDGTTDPWWQFWQGDFRIASGVMAALRKAAQ